MLQAGKSYDQIARLRGLTMGTVIRHMMRLAANGHEFDVSRHVDEELQRELGDVASTWKFGEPIKPVMEALQTECDYTNLQLNLIEFVRTRD
jgi:uncharacterized protein YpbB